MEVSSFEELESRKDEVKGKIVFYNYPFNPTFIKTFHSYGDAVKFRGQGPSRASKYGAVAVIVRSMSHSMDNHPHTGSTRYDEAFPKIAAVAIGLQDADRLSQRIKNDPSMQVFLRTTCEMLPDTIGHNVIGELMGSEFPDEYITVGAHLDSWDNCEGRTMMEPAWCSRLRFYARTKLLVGSRSVHCAWYCLLMRRTVFAVVRNMPSWLKRTRKSICLRWKVMPEDSRHGDSLWR